MQLMVAMKENVLLIKNYGCVSGGCASMLEVSWQIYILGGQCKVVELARGGCVVNGAHAARHMAGPAMWLAT